MLDVLDRFPRERIYRNHLIFRGTQGCIESWFECAMEIIGVVIYWTLLPFHIVWRSNDFSLILLKFRFNCLVEIVVLFIFVPVALTVLVDQIIGLFEVVVVS